MHTESSARGAEQIVRESLPRMSSQSNAGERIQSAMPGGPRSSAPVLHGGAGAEPAIGAASQGQHLASIWASWDYKLIYLSNI